MRMVLAMLGATALAGNAMAQVWGGFAAPLNIDNEIVLQVESGDLNGDGIADIVTYANSRVNVYIATAPAVFALPTNPSVTGLDGAVIHMCLVDVDGDTDLDIVGARETNGTNDARVWINDGAGAFSVGQTILDTAGRAEDVACGDINGDDAPDLLIRVDDSVHILMNDGFGMFGAPTTIAVAGTDHGIASADLDADGLDDVVVADFSGASVRVLLSDGTSLTESGAFAAANGPLDVEIADMNGDAVPDVVVAASLAGAMLVLFNDGTGALTAGATWTLNGSGSPDLDLVDLEADGDMDVVVARSNGTNARAFFNNGDGSSFSFIDYGASFAPNAIAIGDLDGNGSPDLLYGHNDANFGLRFRINETDVVAPGAFDLVSPLNNSIGLPLPETLAQWPGGKPGTAPLKWTTATGFQNTYTVRIARDAAFTDVVLEETDDASPFNVPNGILEIGKRYYWSVDVENPIGLVSATSGSFTFLMRALADLNADGAVDGGDLAILLSSWGSSQ